MLEKGHLINMLIHVIKYLKSNSNEYNPHTTEALKMLIIKIKNLIYHFIV